MLTQAEFRKQISASGKTTLGAIETDGETPRALFFAAFLVDLGAGQPELIAAAKRYAMWHALQEPSAARSRLVSDGCLAFLTSTWNDLGQAHYDGPELVTFAEWILALTTTAVEIGDLPYGFGNWEPSWRSVGKNAIVACVKLAAEALRRDPENESALWLYAQDDFRARAKVRRAPVSLSLEAQVAKVQKILALHQEDVVHPLDVPSLDTIPVTHPAIVDALLEGLTKTPRARHRIIDALGRATVEVDRVVAAFVAELETGDARRIDDVAMALHYGLGKRGVAALEPLMLAGTKLVADLTPETSDYRHQWALRAVLTLRKHARGEARRRADATIDELLAAIEAMPQWKRDRLAELSATARTERSRSSPRSAGRDAS